MHQLFVSTLLLTLTATTALAQAPVRPASTREPIAVLGLNPIALVLGAVIGDFERTVSPSLTLGVGVSVVPEYLTNYRAAEAKLRYYPDEHALHGVSLALTTGLVSEPFNSYDYNTNTQTRRMLSRATIGTELSYQWIIGPSRRFALATGAGAKRLLGSATGFYDGAFGSVIPTFRLNVGVAF